MFQEAFNKRIQSSVHDCLNISCFHSGPVIFHQSIWLEYIGTDLAPPFNRLLFSINGLLFLFSLFQFEFIKFSTEKTQTLLFVLVLRSLTLTLSDNPRWQMGHTYR